MGRDFDLPLVEAASYVTTDELVDAFDEACDRNLVRPSSDRVGRYSFRHALVRQTLYDELSTTRRVRLHRRIGEAIEAAHRDDIEPHLPKLAHHFGEAAAAGDIAKGVDYARRAADQALDQVAYEEAGRLCERALALNDADEARPAMRCELHLLLGAARSGRDALPTPKPRSAPPPPMPARSMTAGCSPGWRSLEQACRRCSAWPM